METAIGVCQALGIDAIEPQYGLNCCAAAKRDGCLTVVCPKVDMSLNISWPPSGDPRLVDERNRRQTGFTDTILDLARTKGNILIVVTHREGIWELQQQAGLKPTRTNYCSITPFQCDHKSRRIKPYVWASSEKGKKMKVSTEKGVKEEDPFRCVLETGEGKVLFFRDGKNEPARLWVTPGAKGVWVEGSFVMSGDIVTLVGGPVDSEEDGEFVQIRLETGTEGWTKVKNIRPVPGQQARSGCRSGEFT